MKGRFIMQFRDGAREWATPMDEGDLIVVPAGAEHRPVAAEECWVMLVESGGTRNTGERVTARTRSVLPPL